MTFIAVGIGAAVSVGTAAYSANQQKKAQGNALDAQESAYGRQQSLLAPYSSAGSQALNQLAALNAGNYSGFESSPDFKYAKEQMTDAVDSNSAARGMLYSGAHTSDLASRIGGLASQNLGSYRSGLMSLANMGQGAAGGMASAAGQYGQAASQSALATGDTNSQLAGAVGGSLANLGGNLATRYGAANTTGASGTYAPSSLWGQQTNAGQGANVNFGNNLTSLYGWR